MRSDRCASRTRGNSVGPGPFADCRTAPAGTGQVGPYGALRSAVDGLRRTSAERRARSRTRCKGLRSSLDARPGPQPLRGTRAAGSRDRGRPGAKGTEVDQKARGGTPTAHEPRGATDRRPMPVAFLGVDSEAFRAVVPNGFLHWAAALQAEPSPACRDLSGQPLRLAFPVRIRTSLVRPHGHPPTCHTSDVARTGGMSQEMRCGRRPRSMNLPEPLRVGYLEGGQRGTFSCGERVASALGSVGYRCSFVRSGRTLSSI